MCRLVQDANQLYKKCVRVTVMETGLKKWNTDRYLFIQVTNDRELILCIYVNNILRVGNKKAVNMFKQEIKNFFNI